MGAHPSVQLYTETKESWVKPGIVVPEAEAWQGAARILEGRRWWWNCPWQWQSRFRPWVTLRFMEHPAAADES